MPLIIAVDTTVVYSCDRLAEKLRQMAAATKNQLLAQYLTQVATGLQTENETPNRVCDAPGFYMALLVGLQPFRNRDEHAALMGCFPAILAEVEELDEDAFRFVAEARKMTEPWNLLRRKTMSQPPVRRHHPTAHGVH